jgi:hypothetical protein
MRALRYWAIPAAVSVAGKLPAAGGLQDVDSRLHHIRTGAVYRVEEGHRRPDSGDIQDTAQRVVAPHDEKQALPGGSQGAHGT